MLAEFLDPNIVNQVTYMLFGDNHVRQKDPSKASLSAADNLQRNAFALSTELATLGLPGAIGMVPDPVKRQCLLAMVHPDILQQIPNKLDFPTYDSLRQQVRTIASDVTPPRVGMGVQHNFAARPLTPGRLRHGPDNTHTQDPTMLCTHPDHQGPISHVWGECYKNSSAPPRPPRGILRQEVHIAHHDTHDEQGYDQRALTAAEWDEREDAHARRFAEELEIITNTDGTQNYGRRAR